MIVSLTINPAIDRNVSADQLVFEDRSYIIDTHESAGGRGVNASCVIHSFGGKTLAIAPLGGESGKRMLELLGHSGFPFHTVPIRQDIRTNLTITDKQGLTIKLNEKGPLLEPEEVDAVKRSVIEHLNGASWLMLCGSVPPGVPANFYAELIHAAQSRGVKTLLDTDGDPLLHGMEANPAVVIPNQPEAERLLNRALITRHHFREAAVRIQAMGAEFAIVTLGAKGAVASDGKRFLEVVPPRVDAVCPIGAGDALAAAFVWARSSGADFAEAVRWGVAAGTASARLPGLLFASLDQTRSVYDKVELREVLL